jgi:hypothetical protein
MDPDEIERYCSLHPDALAMVILQDEGQEQKETILQFGRWDENLPLE